jgi:asparagine synthase (glutamine-hydrolysing)
MPIFEKCRFQHGAVSLEGFAELFPADEQVYRDTFADIFIR